MYMLPAVATLCHYTLQTGLGVADADSCGEQNLASRSSVGLTFWPWRDARYRRVLARRAIEAK